MVSTDKTTISCFTDTQHHFIAALTLDHFQPGMQALYTRQHPDAAIINQALATHSLPN